MYDDCHQPGCKAQADYQLTPPAKPIQSKDRASIRQQKVRVKSLGRHSAIKGYCKTGLTRIGRLMEGIEIGLTNFTLLFMGHGAAAPRLMPGGEWLRTDSIASSSSVSVSPPNRLVIFQSEED